MAKLIYAAICSIDGYTEDAAGKFDWARPDDEVHAAVNELEREIGTYLYGRRMYETMRFWETADTASLPPVAADYADVWRATDKVVYSRTLDAVSSERTRLERDFDADAVRALVTAADRDVSVGGATIAGAALAAGLLDECHLFVIPVAVGGGLPAIQPHGLVGFELLDLRRFDSGTVHVSYRL